MDSGLIAGAIVSGVCFVATLTFYLWLKRATRIKQAEQEAALPVVEPLPLLPQLGRGAENVLNLRQKTQV